MHKVLLAAIGMAGLALNPTPAAAPMAFDMKDPKGVSSLTFLLDSPLEPIRGHTNAISGEIMFDADNPENSSGKIVVEVAQMHAAIPPMTGHMLSEQWLNAEKFPQIVFEVKDIDVVEDSDGMFLCDVTGDFSLHGVTKEIKVRASATHKPDALRARGGVQNADGDLLIVRTNFKINRLDYGIAPDMDQQKVGPIVEIDMANVGVHVK